MQVDTQSSADAGRNLADELSALALNDPVIVVLSPQSVGFAFEAARRLACELDLLLVGYIMAPGHPDRVIGSVLDLATPQVTVDEELAREFHVPPGYLNTERQHQIAELERLHFMYLGDDETSRHDHAGKDVVLVDEGPDLEIVNRIARWFRDAGALSVRIVNAGSTQDRQIDERTIAHLLREARRIHRLLH